MSKENKELRSQFINAAIAFNHGDIEDILKIAESGYIDAQVFIGDGYAKGTEKLDVNINEAIKWYIKAARNKNEYSQNVIGIAYFIGAISKSEYIDAEVDHNYWNSESSNKNNYIKGLLAENGVIGGDFEKLYMDESDKGNSDAQYRLGLINSSDYDNDKLDFGYFGTHNEFLVKAALGGQINAQEELVTSYGRSDNMMDKIFARVWIDISDGREPPIRVLSDKRIVFADEIKKNILEIFPKANSKNKCKCGR